LFHYIIYIPVSAILWFWHKVFGFVLGENNGFAWALSIMFLVFTLRAIMFKPFVKQVRSMRQMQQFAPEIKKIQKKYANDRQRQAAEMQKLQREHGFSPLGGCLPMLIQIPVFIGLFHVLREFKQGKTENYVFDEAGVASYIDAHIFGAKLSNFITQPAEQMEALGDPNRTAVILVSIPLMILASVLTHLTARHSVARQNPESAGTTQTAIMNKLTMYVFPLGVLVMGFFFPIGLLLYWLANNTWTLMQQRVVYRRIDREEEEKKTAAQEKRTALGPKVGQKPTQTKKRPTQSTAKSGESASTDSATTKPAVKQTTKPTATTKSTTNRSTNKTTGTKSGGAKTGGTTAKKPSANGGQASGQSGARKKNTGRKN
jgi:YidC/Oxa1 family membrane protein insertase